jgi:hypothetical protein
MSRTSEREYFNFLIKCHDRIAAQPPLGALYTHIFKHIFLSAFFLSFICYLKQNKKKTVFYFEI